MKELKIKHHGSGTKVYFIYMESTPYFSDCGFCKGEGVLFRKDKVELPCPICKGTGQIEDGGGLKHVVGSGTVENIKITIDEDGDQDIEYTLCHDIDQNIGHTFGNVYGSKKSAQVDCDKQGKGCIMGYTK